LQELREATVPVRAEIGSRPPSGYEAEERITVETPSVRVSGAEDLVGRVVEVVARVDLSRATRDVQANVPLVATNGSGTTIEGVDIEPDSARVRVVIRQTLFERSFAVSPRIKGSPAVGYNVGSIDIDPPTVVLQGPPGSFDRLESVPTEEIDVSGAVADIAQQQVRLVLPQGVRLRNAATALQVRVRISPAIGRAVFGVVPAFEGLGDGMQVRALTPLIEVEVEGPLPQLRALGPSAFTAAVNISGLGVGRYDVAVSARAPTGIRVVSVRPERVPVEVVR
jgi:YbbR domain-containing protein